MLTQLPGVNIRKISRVSLFSGSPFLLSFPPRCAYCRTFSWRCLLSYGQYHIPRNINFVLVRLRRLAARKSHEHYGNSPPLRFLCRSHSIAAFVFALGGRREGKLTQSRCGALSARSSSPPGDTPLNKGRHA